MVYNSQIGTLKALPVNSRNVTNCFKMRQITCIFHCRKIAMCNSAPVSCFSPDNVVYYSVLFKNTFELKLHN